MKNNRQIECDVADFLLNEKDVIHSYIKRDLNKLYDLAFNNNKFSMLYFYLDMSILLTIRKIVQEHFNLTREEVLCIIDHKFVKQFTNNLFYNWRNYVNEN